MTIYKIQPKLNKILEALLFLIQKGQQADLQVTQYDLVKSLFLADTGHVEKYGRPVTYDNYVAMEHGPVASTAYDILKGNKSVFRQFEEELPLWDRRSVGGSSHAYFNAHRAANLLKLSRSDQKALEEALLTVKKLGFSEVRRLTHEHPAYIKAWGEGDNKAPKMNWEDIVPEGDTDLAQDILFASRH